MFSGCPERRKLIPAGQIYIGRRKGNIFGQKSWFHKFFFNTFGQFDWFLDIIRRYKTQVSEINPNRRSTFFCERDMVALEEFVRPPWNEFAWNILGLESKCGDKYLTEPASSKSRRSSRRRNYARIRGDIPSPVQVIVNAMQCGFHTGVAESSSDITYAAAAAEITCLKIQSNSSRITVLRSHHPPFCLLIKLSSSLQIFSTKIPS